MDGSGPSPCSSYASARPQALKLDIDTAALELELLRQIRADPAMPSMIGEAFHEYHVSMTKQPATGCRVQCAVRPASRALTIPADEHVVAAGCSGSSSAHPS